MKDTSRNLYTLVKKLFWMNLKQVLIITICFVTVFPLFWMISTSFRLPEEIFSSKLRLLPTQPSLTNYAEVFQNWPMVRWITNSLIVASGITLGRIVTSILAGYGFAYFVFPGKKVIFFLVLWTLSIPFMITMVPNYILVSKLGLVNTHSAVIIPTLGFAFGVFFIRQHVQSVPTSLFDAAYMDGANSWQILWKVVVPIIKGSIIALTVLIAIEAWNIFFWPMLVLSKESMHTLPIGLTSFQDSEAGVFWGPLMAAATITSIPMLTLYAIARSYLIEASITVGLK
jgi:sn-glycerol 3-phosphate transport system permease protein